MYGKLWDISEFAKNHIHINATESLLFSLKNNNIISVHVYVNVIFANSLLNRNCAQQTPDSAITTLQSNYMYMVPSPAVTTLHSGIHAVTTTVTM